MSHSQRDIPLREHSHINLHHDSRDNLADNPSLDDKLCPGCKKSAVNEHGGLVVAFGQSFFHVDCFKCAKCRNQVTADTNLLLLSDGSPICENCSYSCNVCHLPILDEAIMTGDDSYHAHCFKCKVCKNRIDELVFAKTSQGIYCMNCHNERMIKIRKHTQRKAEREREKAGSASSRSREYDSKLFHQENGRSSPGVNGFDSAGPSKSPNLTLRAMDSSSSMRSPSIRRSGPYISDAFESSGPSHHAQSSSSQDKLPSTSSNLAPPTPSVNIAPPPDSSLQHGAPNPYNSKIDLSVDERLNFMKSNTLPIPPISVEIDPDGRRRSYDDGVRPLNILFKQKSIAGGLNQPQAPETTPAVSDGLNVSTSRRDKRRSINPGLVLTNFNTIVSAPASSPALSPLSGSFRSPKRSPSPPSVHDASHASSPLREQFQQPPMLRNNSHTSSILSYSTAHSSPSSSSPAAEINRFQDLGVSLQPPSLQSKVPPHNDAEDQTVVLKNLHSSVTQPDTLMSGMSSPMRDDFGRSLPSPHPSLQSQNQSSARLSPTDFNSLHSQRSFDDHRRASSRFSMNRQRQSTTSSLDSESNRSRSASPAYRADVPHSVESGTDTEVESDNSRQLNDRPPMLPPKERKDSISRPTTRSSQTSDVDPDLSIMSQPDHSSDDMSESSPVERISHATFIAPALPPIRFSMNTADFSELFNSVGGLPSLKSLDHLAKLSELHPDESILEATLASMQSSESNPTPTSEVTVFSSPLTPAKRIDAKNDFDATIIAESPTKILRADDRSIDVVLNGSDSSHGENRVSPSSSIDRQSSSDFNHDFAHELNGLTNGIAKSTTRITLTEPESVVATTLKQDTADVAMLRLYEVMIDARARGAQQVKLDRAFIEAILESFDARKAEYSELKGKFDSIKRTSKQYIDGLTVAQTEYDRELKARRDAEAEVTRLRVLLSGQAARLTNLSGDSRRQELRQQLSKELHDSLSALEQDLSKLKVERDMTSAEVEELSATKSSVANGSEQPHANIGRSLTMRLDNIKSQYQHDLIPLTQQRTTLTREIAELKAVRDVFLEETTALNARNEELAQLSAVYARRMDTVPEPSLKSNDSSSFQRGSLDKGWQPQRSSAFPQSLSASTTSSSTLGDDSLDTRMFKGQKSEADLHTPSKGKFMKWTSSKPKEATSPMAVSDSKKKVALEHNFQQLSILRFTRCDHCGDKLWGSQLRCTVCHTSIHVRCAGHVHMHCAQSGPRQDDSQQGSLQPSIFGRDLVEQVRADSKGGERQVPIIVEKCIDAVEALALDYEGIYRKTGGSGQSKAITQLFERGDYGAFDLRDTNRFNDICSVTSVMKTYFRSLPIPLLTYDLHDQFMAAVELRDPAVKHKSLLDLVDKLPNEHYYTLRLLMLHLHHVCQRSEKNLMNARNLGVVFGPTLMRSRDPGVEFSDMAGKALSVEWLVENAPFIFK